MALLDALIEVAFDPASEEAARKRCLIAEELLCLDAVALTDFWVRVHPDTDEASAMRVLARLEHLPEEGDPSANNMAAILKTIASRSSLDLLRIACFTEGLTLLLKSIRHYSIADLLAKMVTSHPGEETIKAMVLRKILETAVQAQDADVVEGCERVFSEVLAQLHAAD